MTSKPPADDKKSDDKKNDPSWSGATASRFESYGLPLPVAYIHVLLRMHAYAT